MSTRAALQAIYDEHGELTPELVLAEARNTASVLHQYFTWDTTAAAERWLLHQAHELIQRVRITVRVSPERTVRPRAFVYVPDRGGYMPTETALTSESRDVVMEQALRDIEALRRKYEALLDFDQVLNQALVDAA